MLLYYFGSKDAMVVEIVRRGRGRQRQTMVNLNLSARLPAQAVTRILWRHYSSPQWEPPMRLFFEVYALALQGALRSIRGISMLIGPALSTVVFAQFIGPWRSESVPGALRYLSACFYALAFAFAWRATRSTGQVAAMESEEPAGA